MKTNAHELGRLLVALGRAGIELAARGGVLMHRPSVLSPHLAERLTANRGAVLRLLVEGYTPASDDARYVLGERLGIADELALTVRPGSPAWLVAVGEALQAERRSTTLHDPKYGGIL